jgi:hypothetical protein
VGKANAVSLVAFVSAAGFFVTLITYAVVCVVGRYKSKREQQARAVRIDLERRLSRSLIHARRVSRTSSPAANSIDDSDPA